MVLVELLCKSNITLEVVLLYRNISTAVVILGTQPTASYPRPNNSRADIQYNSTTSSVTLLKYRNVTSLTYSIRDWL